MFQELQFHLISDHVAHLLNIPSNFQDPSHNLYLIDKGNRYKPKGQSKCSPVLVGIEAESIQVRTGGPIEMFPQSMLVNLHYKIKIRFERFRSNFKHWTFNIALKTGTKCYGGQK